MIKIPAWLNEIIITITSNLGIEPSQLVKFIITSVLLVAVVAAVVAVISMLQSLLNRDKQSSDYNAEAKTRAISEAIKPTSNEYERMINDAIENALFPVFRHIKRLENKVFPKSEDTQQTGIAQHTEAVSPSVNTAAASQLYDDVQDVVLPQKEAVVEESQAQDTGLHVVPPPEEEVEHTTIAQIQDSEQQEASPSEGDADTIEDQDTSQHSMSSPEEDEEHTTISRIQDAG